MKYKTGDIAKYKRQLIYKKGRPAFVVCRNHRTYYVVFIYVEERNKWYTSCCAEEDLSDYTGEVPAGAETFIGAHIQSIESSSIPACEYKLLKEIGDFLKRVRFDIIDSENPSSSIYQNDLTKINASNIACMLNASVSVALSFSKQCFLEELYNLLEVVYIDNVTIHVYMLKNPYVRF